MNTVPGILAILLWAACSAALPASDIFGLHKVEKVQEGDRVQVLFNRLPISVRLAHVQCSPEAQAKLEELINGKSVALKYVDELGAHASGDPYVYILLGSVNVNVKLVESGVATYDTAVAKSKLYDADFAKAQKMQEAAGNKPPPPATTVAKTPPSPAKTTPPPAAAGGSICAELRGSFHHVASCNKAQQLSANNKIFFASPEAAEKSGKRPCWSCQPGRADEQAFGSKKSNAATALAVGKLIGLKSDPKFFFTPTSTRLTEVAVDDMVGFGTVQEAKASGRQPDTGCLRLTAPEGQGNLHQPPKDGECIGRSPPFFRPCFRAPADDSGLCTVCQGRE